MAATTPSRATASPDVPTFVIKPSRFGRAIDFAELYAHRYLFGMMALRDVRVKYKQTWLGLAWVMLQPISIVLVFSFMFRGIAHVSTQEIPYPLFVMPGIVLWFMLSRSIGEGSTCLAGNLGLLSKVYFPRIMLPATVIVGHFIDFCVSLSLIAVLMFWYGINPTAAILTAPIFVVVGLGLVLGLSLWLSALDALVRDVRHFLPFLLQIWMFATPVVYPSSAAPGKLKLVLLLNPLTPVVEGFRWSVLGLGDAPSFAALGVTALIAVVLIVGGAAYFRMTERTIIDTM